MLLNVSLIPAVMTLQNDFQHFQHISRLFILSDNFISLNVSKYTFHARIPADLTQLAAIYGLRDQTIYSV